MTVQQFYHNVRLQRLIKSMFGLGESPLLRQESAEIANKLIESSPKVLKQAGFMINPLRCYAIYHLRYSMTHLTLHTL